MNTLPESAWEAIFAEHERDHQHADASRLGCNGCAMLAYTESLRGQLQTLRGERDALKQDVAAARMLSRDAQIKAGTLAQEKAALEARERAMREAAEGARSILTTCRRLYGGSGLGGPAALEADCDFAIRKLDAALAPRPRHEGKETA